MAASLNRLGFTWPGRLTETIKYHPGHFCVIRGASSSSRGKSFFSESVMLVRLAAVLVDPDIESTVPYYENKKSEHVLPSHSTSRARI